MTQNNKPFTLLEWDSSTFGYSIARINKYSGNVSMPETIKELKRRQVRLAYWFVDVDDKNRNKIALENFGVLVDTKVTYVLNLNSSFLYVSDKHIQSYTDTSTNRQLLSLAFESGTYSRFRTDTHFTHGEFEKLYTQWIEQSVKRARAFEVFVYRENHANIQGFVTLEKKNDIGNIGLIAVHKNSRGKAIGTKLVRSAITEFIKRGINMITIITQKQNISACHFYEKLGFAILSTQNVYHFWL